MRNTPEFIDTYSDDLLYLMDLRDSHLTHPGKNVYEPLFQASFARVFCAFMVGNIEAMLENWRTKDSNNVLAPYFIQSSNEEKIKALINNFQSNRITVDSKVLNQYLAIKYVRNAIIHSSWNENQKEFIKAAGFPTDARKLTDEHLQAMYAVNIEMMKYIAATEHREFVNTKFDTKLPDYKRYFTKKQLTGYLWNNLERINYTISQTNEVSKSMFEEASFDWNLFKSLELSENINFDNLDSNISILQKLVDSKKYSTIPIAYIDLEKIKSTDKLDELYKILNIEKAEILPFIEAYSEGKKCYEKMRNVAVSSLLKKLLATKMETTSLKLDKELDLANKLYKLGRLYHDYEEKR